jgi:uncharacterized protein (DUF1697 family)
MKTYVALLRGINVGGKRKIPMAGLKSLFSSLGLEDVATYIQSGNVLFEAPRRRRAEMAAQIESELSGHFGAELKIVLMTAADLRRVVDGAPQGFGAETHRSDVLFLRGPLTPRQVLELVELKEGVDSAWPGRGVVYFSRLAARASSSRLSKLASLPEYRNITVRNWNTTRKLLARID